MLIVIHECHPRRCSCLEESERVSCECDQSRRTGRKDVLHAGVRGEHLAHELLLLLPEVVLQVVRQHHVAGLLHGHHLAEHLQLGPKHSQGQRSVSGEWKPNRPRNRPRNRPTPIPFFCFVLFFCYVARRMENGSAALFLACDHVAPRRASPPLVSVIQSTGGI